MEMFLQVKVWKKLLRILAAISIFYYYFLYNNPRLHFPTKVNHLSQKFPARHLEVSLQSLKHKAEGHEDHKFKPIVPIKYRNDIGSLLEGEGFEVGAELGVKRGGFARITLSKWPSCKRYVLTDAWAPLDNYKDVSNSNMKLHEKIFKTALTELAPYRKKIEICRNLTTNCAKLYSPDTFDYIYVDARHDFKGVLVDLRDWWPLLKTGGIFAGHDYVTQNDGPKQTGQDWTLNWDGSIDETGTVVKGAVDKFAQEVGRQVTITYREKGWNSWLLRK